MTGSFAPNWRTKSGSDPKIPAAAVLQLPGTVATEDASARANHVQVLGVE